MKYRFVLDASWRLIAHELGISAVDILRGAGLPEDAFSRDELPLSSEQFFAFWSSLESRVDDPLFPLRLGRILIGNAFSPLVFAALCSPDLGIALERLSTYKRLAAPVYLEPERLSDRLRVHVSWIESATLPPPSLLTMEFTLLVQLARTATRNHVHPLRISSTAPIERLGDYETFFGVSVEFGEQQFIDFSLDDAARPFLTSNDTMWASFEPDLRRRLGELDSSATTADRVRAALLEALPSGRTSRGAVAKMLAMSERSLSRALRREDTTFRDLVAAVRRELALHYLEGSKVPSAEIAFLLGYDDVNSFYRAFREWTGTTPERVRLETSASAPSN